MLEYGWVRDALPHRCELFSEISQLCEMGSHVVVLPAAGALGLPPQIYQEGPRSALANVF
jgi:hypothetical protein